MALDARSAHDLPIAGPRRYDIGHETRDLCVDEQPCRKPFRTTAIVETGMAAQPAIRRDRLAAAAPVFDLALPVGAPALRGIRRNPRGKRCGRRCDGARRTGRALT